MLVLCYFSVILGPEAAILKKMRFRDSKSSKKIPKKNHSIIGVIEIPNPKYLGKIQKKCYFEHPYR